MKKESAEFSLYGDLDGKTVKQLKEFLDLYPEDAVLDARTEGWSYEEREFFVIMWKE